MIAAICIKINKNIKAKLYLVGAYGSIDWEKEEISVLGEEYATCPYKLATPQKPSIFINRGLDGNHILRIIETKRYVLKIECSQENNVPLPRFQNEGNKFLKCDKDKDSVTFQFINYLGRSRMIFDLENETYSLFFEVVPDKMNYEDDYIGLTESLAEICSELLLEFSGSTSNVYKQVEESPKTLLERFIFLRQFCYGQNLQGLFESVKRNPDRTLIQEEEFKPFGYRQPSKKFYTSPFTYGKNWEKINDYNGSSIYLPRLVAVTQKHDSLDTPANRFIKFALQKFNEICEQLITILDTNEKSKQAECLLEAKAIHRMLENIFKDSFFEEIGFLDIMPQNNQVLQKREGYSQIFAAYSMIDLALQLDWKGKDDIFEGESKNIALLYEYWLFFELFKIIKSIESCSIEPVSESKFLDFGHSLTISLKQGKQSCQSFEIKRHKIKINLYYNRTFSREDFVTTKYEGSYSRPFRPDYTIAIFPSVFIKGKYNGEEEAVRNGAVSYIHFDAKYRISDLSSFIGKKDEFEEDEILEDKVGSIVNTYQRGDLLKMHTYNDAIRRTVGSYVLYPGSGDVIKGQYAAFSMYDEILPGVGAFSIKPSMNTAGENELRNFISRLIESKEKANSRLNRMKYYIEMVLREPVVKSLDVQGDKTETSKDSIGYTGEKGNSCVLGYIRADYSADYFYFLRDNDLLNVGAEFLFYFYAIKGENVYSHHKDIFKATDFRFYTNDISRTGLYKLEPVLCKIMSNELISRKELVDRLLMQGYITTEDRHHADFYYTLTVRVVNTGAGDCNLKIYDVNSKNGNDTFSPHSPKVICY